MNLDEALQQFDIVEANLAKLEAVWGKMRALIPEGIAFFGGSPEDREYRRLRREWVHIVEALPAIDGWRFDASPLDLDVIAQSRLDAKEVGEVGAEIAVEQEVAAPGLQIDEYRSRFATKRQQLVRARMAQVMAEVDSILAARFAETASLDGGESVRNDEWDRLVQLIDEADRLAGGGTRGADWGNLHRHLRFAERCDLIDIVERDWPAVKRELVSGGFEDTEPIPIAVQDLGALVATAPTGPVSTALRWEMLSDDDFERLVFSIISDAADYENPQWLMHTNAPDKGRDLSAWYVRRDSLDGVRRERVLVQCKHWLSRSVGDKDIAEALVKLQHWEPPPVDVLVLATSGRFTTDAVQWVEKREQKGERPRVLLWAESHLERLLAQRPHLIAAFKLR